MAAKIVTAQGSLQNTIRQFTDFGNGAKELFVDPIREAHHVSQIQQKATLNDFNGVLKDNGVGFLNRGTISDKIARYAISKQQGGSELLASMKKEIPTLTESEMSIYQYMRQELERRHPIINQTRKLAGMAPIGYIDDYWMLWRGLDDVFGAGKLVDGDAGWFNTKDIPNLINEEVAAKFVKKRAVNGSEIPISLDAFGDFEKYISISTDYIRKLPTLVYMNLTIPS